MKFLDKFQSLQTYIIDHVVCNMNDCIPLICIYLYLTHKYNSAVLSNKPATKIIESDFQFLMHCSDYVRSLTANEPAYVCVLWTISIGCLTPVVFR